MKLRLVSGLIVAGLACAVYGWSVLSALAHSDRGASASSAAYQYSTGQLSGSGTILNTVSFDFQAKADTTGVRGSCDVQDRAKQKIRCLTVSSLVVVGTHGTFSGAATVNGVTTTFTIDVDDLGEPGVGHDRFAITTGTGYSRSGILTSGNIQVHTS